MRGPRIPVWIGGDSPPALRCAARWDGWIASGVGPGCLMTVTPEEIAGKVETLSELRAGHAPFDIALTGYPEPEDTGSVREYEEGGVTWWLESLYGIRGSPDEMLARAAAGPPA